LHLLLLAAALGSTPAIAQDAVPAGPPPATTPRTGRLVLNTAVMGAGLGLASVGAYNLTQATQAYGDYLREQDDTTRDAMLRDDVRVRQIAGISEIGLAAVCLGVGTVLWVSTDDVSLTVGPNAVGLTGRF